LSREYGRLYGLPPQRDVEQLREAQQKTQ